MNLDKLTKTSRRKADRRWTLLFIGDHGNVITLKRFKAIIMTAGFLFFLAVAFLVVLLFSYQTTLQKNKNLQKRFQASQQQIESLRHEKEILMARLVLAESKATDTIAKKAESNESPPVAKSAETKPQPAVKTKPAAEPKKEPTIIPAREAQPTDHQEREADSIMRVAVENFKVSRDSGNSVKAQFKIKNTSLGYQRVAGKAVVLLKGADLNQNQWVVMPSVNLTGSKPAGKRGKRFSIQRFRTMNFISKAPNHADQFQTAVVYVFSDKGKMLLEQDFAINLPPLPVTSSPPPKEEAASRDEKPADTSERQEQAQETPAAASTPGDDIIDSIENAPQIF